MHDVRGDLPVPPTVRLPMLMTGHGSRWTPSRPESYRAFRRPTAAR
jgi:hypothetical protein